MKYGGSTSWNMVKLAAWMFFAGRFVSVGRTISSFLPFAIFLTLVIVLTTKL
jgi:prepilin signal peptidase PulO-like enzyme (type II secretory pathway)